MELKSSAASLKGVGDKKAKLLGKLGIYTVRDLLYYMPRAYENPGQFVKIEELKPDEAYSISAVIENSPSYRTIRKGITLTTFRLSDGTGSVDAVFFNQPYMSRMYKSGDNVCVSGKTKLIGKRLQFTNPHIEKGTVPRDGLCAIYPLTAGITQKVMRLIIKSALAEFENRLSEIFPNDFRQQHGLAEVNYSIKNIHLPQSEQAIESSKRRLIFEELLLFSIALMQAERKDRGSAKALYSSAETIKEFESMLPFVPTNAQKRVMKEIQSDLAEAKPMNRLLQGDVGSGKTMPAFYAMYICFKNSMQSVMMAPTEVLAKQHFKNVMSIFMGTTISIELITGSTPASQRKNIYENVSSGLTDIVIGTHAVLYDNVQFFNLGLVITDEQQRFGVSQRAVLESKSVSPHALIMSATPIPRTLALILYGKTDISIIDEMPPGRQPVKTFVVGGHKRSDMYKFLRDEIKKGSQIFVVCPLIEESDVLDVRSSEQVYDELKGIFGVNQVGLLHGRMKPEDKNKMMDQFKSHEFAILVSTTVIEVGVDVPNATIMIIENADMFGLAQLHQLRGRVGRGEKRSYCFLMCDNDDVERLNILTKTNDGFKIAEEDLKLRGPGQFLGSKQSGASDLYMANLIGDMKLLKYTRQLSEQLLEQDKELYNNLLKASQERFSFNRFSAS